MPFLMCSMRQFISSTHSLCAKPKDDDSPGFCTRCKSRIELDEPVRRISVHVVYF